MSLKFNVCLATILTALSLLFNFIKEIKKESFKRKDVHLAIKLVEGMTKEDAEEMDVHLAIKLVEGMTKEDAEEIAIHALADELIKNKELVHFEKVWRQWENFEKASTEGAEWLIAKIKIVEDQK